VVELVGDPIIIVDGGCIEGNAEGGWAEGPGGVGLVLPGGAVTAQHVEASLGHAVERVGPMRVACSVDRRARDAAEALVESAARLEESSTKGSTSTHATSVRKHANSMVNRTRMRWPCTGSKSRAVDSNQEPQKPSSSTRTSSVVPEGRGVGRSNAWCEKDSARAMNDEEAPPRCW
jgi:hypothetical protein